MRGNRERILLASGTSFRVLRWTHSLREVEVLSGPAGIPIVGAGDHWHYHAEMEMTLFTSGEGTRCVGDHMAPFAATELVVLGGLTPHCWHVRGGCSGISVQWHFPPGHPFWAFPETQGLAWLFQDAAHGLHLTGRSARGLADGLRECAGARGPGRLGIFLRLLDTLAGAPAEERTLLSRRVVHLPPAAAHQQALGEVIRFLLTRFRERIRLEEVLLLTGMSKPTFSRLFKQHTGKAFSEFLNQLRLQAACQELAGSDLPVLDIALACGFTQVSFFNRLFRRVCRCNPTQYRTRNRPPSASGRASLAD